MSVKLDFSILDRISAAVPEYNVSAAESKRYYKLEAEERQKAEIAEAAEKQREMYAAYQKAIIKSEQFRSEITKGVQMGEKPELLLLKAIECISLITGDSVFYEVNRAGKKLSSY